MTEPVQQDFFTLVIDLIKQVFSMIPSWLWVLLSFLVFSSCFLRVLSLLTDGRPVSFAGLGSWIKRKIADLMCKTHWGFKLMFKLGWAVPGVHFFDCGVHCHVCPEFAKCDRALRDSGNP